MAYQVIAGSRCLRFTDSVVAQKAGGSMKWSFLRWKGNEPVQGSVHRSGFLDFLRKKRFIDRV